MPEFSEEQLEDLKDWAKDPKGEPFWATLRAMFADGIRGMRAAAVSGETVPAARYAGHIDTLEEVLDLPSLIIQNNAANAPHEERKRESF